MLHFGISAYAPLAIYVGAIIAAILSITKNPRIGFYYLVPLLPMQTVRYWLHDFFWGEKLVDVLLASVLVGLFIRSERPVFIPSRLNRIIISFSALTFVALWEGSILQSLPFPISLADERFSDWKNYVEMMCVFFVAAAALRTTKQMVITIALVCISVLAVNRSFRSNVAGHDYSQFSEDLRDPGPLGYAGQNGMGAFEALMAVFLIGLTSFAKRKMLRIALWGVALTCVYCLVFTFSRGGYLGLLVGVLVLGIIRERKLLLALVILLATWQAIVPNAVRERVFMTYQGGQLDSSAGERVALWTDAWDVITHNPVLGRGFDTYQFMGRVGPYRDTHNYYLKLLVELGFVGLFFFLWLVGCGCRMAWQLFRTAEDPFLKAIGCALVSTLACAVILNLFGDRWSYLQVTGFLWIFLGMAARGLWLTAREKEMEEAHSPSDFASTETAQVYST